MAITGSIGIVADDLTGANDTALQFFMRGANTKIIFDAKNCTNKDSNVDVWSLSTETRNTGAKHAAKEVWDGASGLRENLGVENFYKKIDSTLRGNVAIETLSMLDAIGYDAAIIAPAFIQEGRITIGGYQLLKGIPIERTDAARDTYAPIYDSYIPDILKKQINENLYNTIGTIELKTVTKGAFGITNKLAELIENNKKLIVVDAVSLVDLEQIALSIEKSQYKILPVGSAGLAGALSNIWHQNTESENIKKEIPVLPKLILSGSKTSITKTQIDKLKLDDDIDNTYFIDLCLDDILDANYENMSKRIVQNLGKDNIVVVHVNKIEEELNADKNHERLVDEGITKESLGYKITDYLSELAKLTNKEAEYILITIGGETSYKCTNAIDCRCLKVIDGILPAISLCIDTNSKFIVTKSGNMGAACALIDIINYFKYHEK